MIDKIKNDFYYKGIFDEFKSSDYYTFFGYSRHSSFKRFLDQEVYYPNIWCESWGKVKERTRNAISFDRKLFLKLCQLKKCLVKEVEDIAVEYYSDDFKKRIQTFQIRKKNDDRGSLNIYNIPCGKYYTYSLNTVNLANDLLLCPYELFKFISDGGFYFEFMRCGITNEYRENYKKIPYFTFDNVKYQQRNEFLALVNIVLANFEMDHISKRLAKIYFQLIKEMLNEQIRIDHLREEKVEQKKKHRFKKVFNPSSAVKDMYRKACKLYHPDKNPEGEEIFKIINEAYHSGNVSILKKYSSIQ